MHFSSLTTFATLATLLTLTSAADTVSSESQRSTASLSSSAAPGSTSCPPSTDSSCKEIPNESHRKDPPNEGNMWPTSYLIESDLHSDTFVHSLDFKNAVEEEHTRYRNEHDEGPGNFTAVWNTTLAEDAERVARACKKELPEDGLYGVNMAEGSPNASYAVQAWANGRELYDFEKGEGSIKTDSFTQLVWKGTTDYGCGRAYCAGGPTSAPGGNGDTKKAVGWSVVCNYWPKGNVEGQFKENVVKENFVGAANEVLPKVGLALVTVMAVVAALVV